MLVRDVKGRHVPRVQGLRLSPSEADVTGGTDDVGDVACVVLGYLGDRKDRQRSHGESLFAAVVGCTEVESKVVGSQLM